MVKLRGEIQTEPLPNFPAGQAEKCQNGTESEKSGVRMVSSVPGLSSV